MDDPSNEFAELEAELKRLRPAPPSGPLTTRLANACASRRRPSMWWAWSALPVAAALAVGFFINRPRPSPIVAPAPVASSPFRPVAAENVLYAARDEGYVTLEDGTPARRVRSNYVDTITWKNPRTNASLRWTVRGRKSASCP